MKKLNLFTALFALVFVYACNSGGDTDQEQSTGQEQPQEQEEPETAQSIKEGKGIGEIKQVDLTEELDESMIKVGESIYNMKCASCHKLTDQKVVGPGFEGVTNRRKPEWIMNMITNTDVMLDEDPAAQALLEECLTRMPNQNISTGDARQILEFLRKDDMERLGKKDEAI